MGNLVFQATLGGQVNLVGPNTASTYNINVPAVAGNMVTTGDTGTVSSTMLASSLSLTTPNLGTPSAGTLTNCTGLPATTGVTGVLPQANGGTGTTTGYYGFKNRIINGAMVIDQRNAGASVTPAGVETYTVDRFSYIGTQASKFTFQQNAGSVTPPTGFKNYLGFTVASAVASPASTDQFAIYHKIEGLNSSDLDFGLSTAATVTVSFWVRSSLTGTFSGGITNSAGNRSYVFNYTISSANTWEQKAVTITGDTSGTWLTTNGIGIQLRLDLGSGPNQDGTASAWQAADKMRTSGSVRVVSTAGATFYITGVQLEKGSTATSFDYRPYGTELALCQRYYQNSGSGAINNYPAFHYGTGVYTGIVLPVVMRASPTVTGTGQALTYFEAGNTFTLTGGVFDSGTTYVSIQYTSSGGTNGYAGTFKPVYQLSAEL